jgi:23S rRNA pseudouridine955/2504/2580 synthase/23S rRNA pseudouridine1911/1915/1917 synthase
MSKKPPGQLEVLYIDDHVVVVNKPAGLPVIPLRTGRGLSLRELVAQELKGEPPHVVHRIDRETSGVVLFAREGHAHREISLLFQHRRVEKTYLGVVRGRPVPSEGSIELALKHDSRDPARMVVARSGGKPSHTDYRTLEVFRGFTLLELKPRTGRMHQLRVHLSARGYPLAVDPLYGGGEAVYLSDFKRDYRAKKNQQERPLISRLSLHARGLRLTHPATGVEVFVEAPLPHDFEVFLKQLRRHAALPDEH